ncbi:MAG: hypothetical protein ACE5GN_05770 [Waddliaceae bacterium]
MHNLSQLEVCYKKFIEDISNWLPEDIITVDLNLLHQFNLLHYHDPNFNDPSLTRYFHVIESNEKITLYNEEFVVWIVPEKVGDIAVTYTLIALNRPEEPKLEMCFVASGIYNTSRLVLRVLEKFLFEIQENEELIKRLEKKAH